MFDSCMGSQTLPLLPTRTTVQGNHRSHRTQVAIQDEGPKWIIRTMDYATPSIRYGGHLPKRTPAQEC